MRDSRAMWRPPSNRLFTNTAQHLPNSGPIRRRCRQQQMKLFRTISFRLRAICQLGGRQTTFFGAMVIHLPRAYIDIAVICVLGSVNTFAYLLVCCGGVPTGLCHRAAYFPEKKSSRRSDRSLLFPALMARRSCSTDDSLMVTDL